MIDEWSKGAKYWDHAWNPMIGCRKVSEGCANCYAARLAAQYPELQSADGGFEPHPPKRLKMPPKSGVVFVGNMTDIFGDWNDACTLFDWFHSLSTDAENLVLTKRAHRLPPHSSMKHIHVGITAENQARYDERIARFVCFWQAGIPWLSAEPLLGPIDMGLCYFAPDELPFGWVVVGAESGPNRRPCKLAWVRLIVGQCRDYGIPVFVKQLNIGGALVKDIEKFPEDLQIRQVPWKKGGVIK